MVLELVSATWIYCTMGLILINLSLCKCKVYNTRNRTKFQMLLHHVLNAHVSSRNHQDFFIWNHWWPKSKFVNSEIDTHFMNWYFRTLTVPIIIIIWTLFHLFFIASTQVIILGNYY